MRPQLIITPRKVDLQTKAFQHVLDDKSQHEEDSNWRDLESKKEIWVVPLGTLVVTRLCRGSLENLVSASVKTG